MPITIQEIIASDTISQLVDKTNFNFDQLLLNGGGPSGPTGIAGPTGPSGGRGPKGSTWYDDASTTTPGVSPNVTPPTVTPLSGDYYLQFNGQVWEYNGTIWVVTTIDLQGPTGAAGTTGGFSLAYGQGNINNINSYYPAPNGLNAGATTTNQGVMSIMMGGVVSNTVPIDAAIPLTNAYIIPDAIATAMASDVLSVLIHQRDSAATAIKFHGGNSIGAENYEQTTLGNLSGIQLGVDDRLRIVVPKAATNPSTQSDLIGYEVSTAQRAQYYSAGQSIQFATGLEGTQQFSGQNSNFEIAVGNGATSNAGNKFKMSTSGTESSTLTEAGNANTITLLNTSTLVGNWQAVAGRIRLVSSLNTEVYSGQAIRLETTSASAAGLITLQTKTGGMQLNSVGGPITIQQTSNTVTQPITISNNDNNILITTSGAGEIASRTEDDGSIKNAVVISAGVSNTYTLNNAGFDLTTEAPNAVTLIKGKGSGSSIAMDVLAADGEIELGTTSDSASANIKLYYRGGTTPDRSIINTRGRLNWSIDGSGVTVLPVSQPPVWPYRKINTKGILGGNIVTQTGDAVLPTDAGVAMAAFIDGAAIAASASSIFVGKPNYYQAGGSFAPSNELGIFVNSTNVFTQGPLTSTDSASFSPAVEKFSVTEDFTKISNRLIYGGKNGVQTVYFDPLRQTSPNTNIVMTSPYLRLVVGSDARGGAEYTAAALTAGTIGNNLNFTYNFNITVDQTTNNWLEGQFAFVELINSNNMIIINNGGVETILKQYGQVNLNYAVFKNVSGIIEYSQPGIQFGVQRSLVAVTPDPSIASNVPGTITTQTSSNNMQLRGSDVDKVQFRFVEGGQGSGSNVVTTNTLPLYWGLVGKSLSVETYLQDYS
jgi:hypothetical protein